MARKFFEIWRASLKGPKLVTFEKFTMMIGSHWAGIAADCLPENEISLGFIEGLINKIRAIQRRHRDYGMKNISASKSSRACCRRY
jgi:transposase